MAYIRVLMQAENTTGKSILVFLRPLRPSRNVNIHAWQNLELSTGSDAIFQVSNQVSASVEVRGYCNSSVIASKPQITEPQELLKVSSGHGLSPIIGPASRCDSLSSLTPSQYGIVNRTNPGQSLSCCWYVGGEKVITVPDVDVDMVCTFECEMALYFMVASPISDLDDYTVQCFSQSVKYIPPSRASVIDVIVTRNESKWDFDFKVVPDCALREEEYYFAAQ